MNSLVNPAIEPILNKHASTLESIIRSILSNGNAIACYSIENAIEGIDNEILRKVYHYNLPNYYALNSSENVDGLIRDAALDADASFKNEVSSLIDGSDLNKLSLYSNHCFIEGVEGTQSVRFNVDEWCVYYSDKTVTFVLSSLI